MGFGTWTLLVVGALLGQVVTVFNFLLVGGWQYLRGQSLEAAVEEAVHRGLRDCLDLESGLADLSTTTTTTSLGPFEISIRIGLELRIIILVVISILVTGGSTLLVIRGCCSRPVHLAVKGAVAEPDSSASSPVALQTLARNQLAEIRLRNAVRPLRLGGV